MPLAPRRDWTAEMAVRMRKYMLLKFVGVTAFTWAFFIGYFHLLRHPRREVFQMPALPLDDWVAFQPHAFWLYVSLWVYIGVAPGLMLRLGQLIVYGVWVAGLCATGLACFYLWPTEVAARTMDVSGHAGFAILQGVDAAGNACPSMHVAAALFTALWVEHLLRRVAAPAWLRGLNALWFVAIAYSTLAIKQHVVLDVLAGGALGLVFALVSLHFSGERAAPAARA